MWPLVQAGVPHNVSGVGVAQYLVDRYVTIPVMHDSVTRLASAQEYQATSWLRRAAVRDRRRRRGGGSAGRGGCGPRARMDIDVGEVRVPSTSSTCSPVSSRASRTAASHGRSPASICPPGATQIPNTLCRCSTNPRRPTMRADAVTCIGLACSSNGSSPRRSMAARNSSIQPCSRSSTRWARPHRGNHLVSSRCHSRPPFERAAHGSREAEQIVKRRGDARHQMRLAVASVCDHVRHGPTFGRRTSRVNRQPVSPFLVGLPTVPTERHPPTFKSRRRWGGFGRCARSPSTVGCVEGGAMSA